MSNRSMTDVAFEIMTQKKQEVPFIDLWSHVSTEMGFTPTQAENKIAQFYSAMMLDIRFAALAENMWDLRARRTYNETHFDTSSIALEDDSVKDDEIVDQDYDEDEEYEKTPNDEETPEETY